MVERKVKSSRRRKSPKQSFESRVKKIVQKQAETKANIFPIVEAASNTLSSPSVTYTMNALSQGTTDHNRIGNSVMGQMMDIRGSVYCQDTYPIYHKIIVLEKNIQSDPLLDLLENNTGNFAPAASNLRAIYARINTHKYRILGTRIVKTGTVSGHSHDANAAQLFKMTVKTPGRFDYDEGQTQPQKRQIVLLMISRRADNDEVSGSAVELTFNAKWYFKDM